MAGINIGVGGAWKEMANLSVGVSGAWKQVERVSIGVGGAWKSVWQYLGATLSGSVVSDTAVAPADATAGIKVDSDGGLYELVGSTYTLSETWLTGGGAASDYESRWTNTSGTLSSANDGVWASCGSDVGYNRNNTNNFNSTQTCSGTLEIRMAAAPNTVLASASYTLEAVVEP